MASTEAARAEAFAAQADRSRELAGGYVDQAIRTAKVIRDIKTDIERQLGAIGIQHRWGGPNGTTLEIMSPNGEWMLGPDLRGLRGKGIQSIAVNGSYHLIITYEDDEEVDAGLLPSGEDGDDGDDGVSIVSAEIDENGHLILGRSIGLPLDAGKVTGEDGEDGDDGVSIVSAEIADGHLILTYSNAAEVDLGDISGPPGRNITGMSIDGSGHLIASYSSGTSPVDLGKVVGENGLGSGTVTSVGLSMPTGFSLSGSPITSSGSFTVGWAAGYAPYTTAEQSKLGNLTVTGATDLDAIRTRVAALDAAVILKGTWSAASGSFPGSGTAQAGESWVVSADGTVGGQAFNAGDRIIAITDNASTSTFAGNWFKADYTDIISSIDGTTGAVTVGAVIAAATSKATPVDADKLAMSDSAASNATKHLTFADLKAWIWTQLGSLIAGGTAKTTPVDADTLPLSDSAASGATKKLAWSDLKARLFGVDTAVAAGFTGTAVNDGTKSSGTYTPTPAGGNLKRIVNGGAFTLAAPSASGDYTLVIQITNNGSAGTITLSGFSKTSGDAFATTNGNDYFLFITKINGFTHAHRVALQ